MSDDLVDDLHYAEDLIGAYQVRSAALLETRKALDGVTTLEALLQAVARLRTHMENLAGLVTEPYCRLSCGHRNWLENDGQEGATMTGDEDCQDQYCGCPCHVGEEFSVDHWQTVVC